MARNESGQGQQSSGRYSNAAGAYGRSSSSYSPYDGASPYGNPSGNSGSRSPYSGDRSTQSGAYGYDPYGSQPVSRSQSQTQASAYGTVPVTGRMGYGHGQQTQSVSQPSHASRSGQSRGQAKKRGQGGLVGVLTLLIGLVLGAVLGIFLIGPRLDLPLSSVSASLTADQLDTVVGSYTYDGNVYAITAREALNDAISLENDLNDDGTYAAPTADMILSYARNRILNAQVEAAGITVSDDEVSAYMQDYAGTTNVAIIAAEQGMDQDQATRLLTQAAAVRKLRDSIIGNASEAPQAPEAPADGDTETTNATYAAYVINLLGDNWDATAGTWANTDNPYYDALSSSVLSPTSANYETAEIAYNVAYQQYLASSSSASSLWDDYVNQELDKAAIKIYTLRT